MKAKMLLVGFLSVIVSQSVNAMPPRPTGVSIVNKLNDSDIQVSVCNIAGDRCSDWAVSGGRKMGPVYIGSSVYLLYNDNGSIARWKLQLPYVQRKFQNVVICLNVIDTSGKVVAVTNDGDQFNLQARLEEGM